MAHIFQGSYFSSSEKPVLVESLVLKDRAQVALNRERPARLGSLPCGESPIYYKPKSLSSYDNSYEEIGLLIIFM